MISFLTIKAAQLTLENLQGYVRHEMYLNRGGAIPEGFAAYAKEGEKSFYVCSLSDESYLFQSGTVSFLVSSSLNLLKPSDQKRSFFDLTCQEPLTRSPRSHSADFSTPRGGDSVADASPSLQSSPEKEGRPERDFQTYPQFFIKTLLEHINFEKRYYYQLPEEGKISYTMPKAVAQDAASKSAKDDAAQEEVALNSGDYSVYQFKNGRGAFLINSEVESMLYDWLKELPQNAEIYKSTKWAIYGIRMTHGWALVYDGAPSKNLQPESLGDAVVHPLWRLHQAHNAVSRSLF